MLVTEGSSIWAEFERVVVAREVVEEVRFVEVDSKILLSEGLLVAFVLPLVSVVVLEGEVDTDDGPWLDTGPLPTVLRTGASELVLGVGTGDDGADVVVGAGVRVGVGAGVGVVV